MTGGGKGRAGFWLLFALALAVYATMVLWTLPAIRDAAGGLAAFDMQPGGYSHAEALAFLDALTETGRALFTGPQRWLDLAYPALMGAVLVLALWHLSDGRATWLRLGLLAIPVAAAGFDYLENLRVAGLLDRPVAEVTQAAVASASRATVLKSALSSVAFVLVLALLVVAGLKRWREKNR